MQAFVDLGNTKIKFLKNDVVSEFSYHKVDLIRIAKHLEASSILYLSVVSLKRLNEFLQVLSDLKSKQKIKILFFKGNNLANKYQDIKKLKLDIDFVDITNFLDFKTEAIGIGIDRLLSIAFANTVLKSSFVITLGTAITVDLIRESKHLGGFILPGLYTQYNSITTSTDISLGDFEFEFSIEPALETKAVVFRGISNTLFLGLKALILELANKYKINDLIISGGDKDLFTKYLEKSEFKVKKYDNMVLRGLELLMEGK